MTEPCLHVMTRASHDRVFADLPHAVWHDEIVCDDCQVEVWYEHYADPALDPQQCGRGPDHDPHAAHSMWDCEPPE